MWYLAEPLQSWPETRFGGALFGFEADGRGHCASGGYKQLMR
jgi:hypothetical protein